MIQPTNKDFRDFMFMLAMLVFCALLLHLCTPEAQGQEVPKERVSVPLQSFVGGLVTTQNPYTMRYDQFISLHNFDIDYERGSLALRKGFKALTDSLTRTITGDTVMVGTIIYFDTLASGVYIMDCRLGASYRPAFPAGFFDGDTLFKYDQGAIQTTAPDSIWPFVKYETSRPDSGIFTLWGYNNPGGGAGFAVGDSIALRMNLNDYGGQIDTGSITGVYAYYDRYGREYLATISPGFGAKTRWSALMISDNRRYTQQHRLFDYIFRNETPIWATWKNTMYVALPRQRPVQYDGQYARPLVPRAPGQVEIVPIIDGSLNGLYRWAIHQIATGSGADTGSFTALSYVSPLTKMIDEDALLYGFHRQAHDSLKTATNTKFHIMRTRGYQAGARPEKDTFFVVATFDIAHSAIDTLTYIDQTGDASLDDSVTVIYPLDSATFATNTHVYDTLIDTIGLTGLRFSGVGAPKYLKRFYTTDSVGGNPWVPPTDALKNDPKDSKWFATGYFYTFFDTLTGAESDSSLNLTVNGYISDTTVHGAGTGDTIMSAVRLSLPALNTADSNMVRVLYRYMWYMSFVDDTTYKVLDTVAFQTFGGGQAITQHYIRPDGTVTDSTRVRSDSNGVRTRWVDKTVSRYRPRRTAAFPVIALTNDTQTIYVDTLTWAQLFGSNEVFVDATDTTQGYNQGLFQTRAWNVPQPLNTASGVYAFKDHLWLWEGSRLYRSVTDTAGLYRPFQDVAFNLDDGDEITQVISQGPNLHVYKNFSQYVLYDVVAGVPTRSTQNKGVGCVAPHSMRSWGGKLFYLSAEGVIVEQSDVFKDYAVKTGLVSDPIRDLIIGDRPMDSLKMGVATIVDDKYLLTFPGTDTTFVYHIPLNAWSTYGFSFWQATDYDTLEFEGLALSNKMVFSRYGDERIFEYAKSPAIYYDSGITADIIANAKTRPLVGDGFSEWEVSEYSINANKTTTPITVSVLNDTLYAGASKAVTNSDLPWGYYFFPDNVAASPSLQISTAAISGVDSVIIRSVTPLLRLIRPNKEVK